MQIAVDLSAILSIVLSALLALLAQMIRQRKQIGLAESDPVQFAIKKIAEQFAFQDDSLYVMSVLSKLLNALLRYMGVLLLNGETKLVEELKELTQMLEARILAAQIAQKDTSSLTEDQKIIFSELEALLKKGGLRHLGGQR